VCYIYSVELSGELVCYIYGLCVLYSAKLSGELVVFYIYGLCVIYTVLR